VSVDALLLAPGAGSDRTQSTLVAIEDALAPVPVERMDFPYRKEGRAFPDRAPKLVASVRAEADALAGRVGTTTGSVVLGGRSMGGRMCSMAVAEGLPAAGLVLICYPLHPPKKPDKLRVEHLPAVDVPCLFISGTRDQFGSPDELEAAHALVAGPVTAVWIDGGHHELKGADDQIVEAVTGWLDGLGRAGQDGPAASL
jgi:predicted alpha/beta-hydrolase family hydrolase